MAEEVVQSSMQTNFFSTDPETLGFDFSAGDKWIYPENFPRRDYQFSIVQTALYSNTLVCLPTGLGKTFIAAVIMYNFWRWYPKGRIVFLAPTKPLVTQQISACNEIMGIPIDQTIELTGAVNQNKRQQAWTEKRVVFATPQTFQKDIQNDYVPCELIKCIVIDEAHKALGKHSYCEIIHLLNKKTKFFRILALSATPGSKIDQVQQVINNLKISELELRDDSSPDILPYINDRLIEKVIVRLSNELRNYKDRYINIMDRHVRILINCKILQGNLNNITKGKIFILLKQYESAPKKSNNHGTIMKTLNILLTMYHAFDLLIKHGLRAFHNFYSNHSDKFWLKTELELQLLLEDILKYIGNLPVIQPLHDGTIPDIPDHIVFGHDKFHKLCDLLVEHFQSFSQQKSDTRAIVFVEYRDSVNEAYILLLQRRPLIRPQMFVGRAGFNQKQQFTALEDFRNNKVNVLISTSVGEEGLDVGEVDLIICFDISSSTPIRLVQRMGRTGRKRSGRVVVLLTEGQEEMTFCRALSKKNTMNNKVLQSSNITSSLYNSSPRMVPAKIIPQCLSIFIKAQPKAEKIIIKKKQIEKKTRKKKKDIILQDNFISTSPTPNVNVNTKTYSKTQSTMMKFLTDQHQLKTLSTCNYESDSGSLSEKFETIDNEATMIRNPYTVINPTDVKLFTSDSHALEFLTLCAMKKSEDDISDRMIIKIDKYIPVHSSIDVFHDFHIPNLHSLDCIKNLTYCNQPLEKEDMFISNDCIFSIVNKQNSKDFNMKNIDYTVENDFFYNDLSTAESKKENFEMSISDFFQNDNSAFKSKLHHSENNEEKKLENQNNNHFFTNDFDTLGVGKESQYLFRKSDDDLIANVEVDFQSILDECTESEESDSQSLNDNRFEQANIFDELLDGTSSDADIFDSSHNEDNITVLPNIQNNQMDNTIINLAKSTIKRSASISPCQGSAKKKQRISDIESSDDSIIIPGTPPKFKQNKSTLDNNKVVKSIVEHDLFDSDQDLFDDLDFDPQFIVTSVKDKILLTNEKTNDVNKNVNEVFETNVQKFFDEKTNEKSLFKKVSEVCPFRKSIIDEKNEIKENINEDDELLLQELSLIEKNIVLNDTLKQNEIDDKRLSGIQKKNLQTSKSPCILNISHLNLDDWNDDFSFINSPTKPLHLKGSPYSGYVATDTTKEIVNEKHAIIHDQSLVLYSDNKFNRLTNSNKNSPLDKEKICLMNANEKKNKYSFQDVKRSELCLSNVKRNFIDNVKKDKDFFIIQDKAGTDTELKKANQLSSLNVNIKKSPQFKKYFAENICNKKSKTKVRRNKFIDNEAEVNLSNETSDESSGEKDEDLENFISYTQEEANATEMKAYYLQSLNKSPVRAGAFMFKPLNNIVPDSEIYSQVPLEGDNSYVNDSFCVEDETYIGECGTGNFSNDSVLENIEKHLEEERKKKKKKKNTRSNDLKNNEKYEWRERNKRNNKATTTSSSEDETEALRKQVLEESLYLKHVNN